MCGGLQVPRDGVNDVMTLFLQHQFGSHLSIIIDFDDLRDLLLCRGGKGESRVSTRAFPYAGHAFC
jgi:hypothetical protein